MEKLYFVEFFINPAIPAAVNAKPFLNKGNKSFVLVIIGAKPKIPNNIPHKGERRAKNPIDMT